LGVVGRGSGSALADQAAVPLPCGLTELSSRLDRVEARFVGTVEFEVGELKTAVVKMDGRLYDLATGRHIPLIIPSR